MLHRHARPAVAGAYLSGAISGALVTASALLLVSGLLSPLPTAVRTTLAAVALLGLVLRSVGLLPIDLPQRAHQIPRETFGTAPAASAFRFAFELGTGVRTYVTASSPYALVVLLALALPRTLGAAVVTAAIAALGYGIGRSIVVVGQALRRSMAVDHPSRWLRAADLVALITALGITISS